ncbi:hypothetical protein CEXT_762601 [Caerostris extrusa]|uniref:Uncharacterized protein n=1 Tax=Caerostris extrusa TaxID=172846 RepID=A0AAV4S6G5_CAEEX|nr:hypothetical protein CEXT_762601 [Caerostris extrusa]
MSRSIKALFEFCIKQSVAVTIRIGTGMKDVGIKRADIKKSKESIIRAFCSKIKFGGKSESVLIPLIAFLSFNHKEDLHFDSTQESEDA